MNLAEITATDSSNSGVQEPNKIDPSTLDTVVYGDPSKGFFKKLSQEELKSLGITEPIEIRPPYTKRIPNENPFYIRMLDSDLKECGMLIKDTVITSLRISPNPQTFTINSAKIITRYNTMTRWVEEHWGDEIDSITFSGSTYAFIGYPTMNVGLTNYYQNSTYAYGMFRELASLFDTNGMLYQDNISYEGASAENPSLAVTLFLNDTDNTQFRNNHPRAGLAKERIYLNLLFDYVSLLGYFETFDISEDSEKPFNFVYNSIFKAEKTQYNIGSLATGAA